MKVNDLRRGLIRLTRRVQEVNGWNGAMEDIPEEKRNQKFDTVSGKLLRKFNSVWGDRQRFLQKFFEGEIGVETSWRNQEHVVEAILYAITKELAKYSNPDISERERMELEEESKRMFFFTKVFGPLRVPGEQKYAATVYEDCDFVDWIEEVGSQADFHSIWGGDLVQRIVRLLASQEDPPKLCLRPKSKVLSNRTASERIGLSKDEDMVDVAISKCGSCGRKFLSLGGKDSLGCTCGSESFDLVAGHRVDLLLLDLLDLANSLHTMEIWRTTQEEIRGIIERSESAPPTICGKGSLLSIFAGLLCVVSEVETTPSNIARAATEEEYRSRLLEKAREKPAKVANRLKGREKVRRIAVAFWTYPRG